MNLEIVEKIQVNRVASIHCAPDWSWDTISANWEDYDLWTVLQGRGQLRAAGQLYPLSGGDCFLLRPHERYLGEHDPANPLWVICIHFDFRDGSNRSFHPQPQEIPALHRRLPNFSFFTQLLERVMDAPTCEKDLWLKAVLSEIQRTDQQQETSRQFPWLEELCTTIRRHPEHPFSVFQLAEGLGYSPDHFGRLFKKYTCLSPADYIIYARIEHARELLLESNLSVQRISELLGYSDVFYFSKQFKQKTGISPLKFRKQ